LRHGSSGRAPNRCEALSSNSNITKKKKKSLMKGERREHTDIWGSALHAVWKTPKAGVLLACASDSREASVAGDQ
jgi:hypothetical protein